jgi:hypothetical protein
METGERDPSLMKRWIQIARDGGWRASFGWRGSLADQGVWQINGGEYLSLYLSLFAFRLIETWLQCRAGPI